MYLDWLTFSRVGAYVNYYVWRCAQSDSHSDTNVRAVFLQAAIVTMEAGSGWCWSHPAGSACVCPFSLEWAVLIICGRWVVRAAAYSNNHQAWKEGSNVLPCHCVHTIAQSLSPVPFSHIGSRRRSSICARWVVVSLAAAYSNNRYQGLERNTSSL